MFTFDVADILVSAINCWWVTMIMKIQKHMKHHKAGIHTALLRVSSHVISWHSGGSEIALR